MTFLKKRVEDSIKQAKLLAQRVVPAKRWVYRAFVLEAFGETKGVLGWV